MCFILCCWLGSPWKQPSVPIFTPYGLRAQKIQDGIFRTLRSCHVIQALNHQACHMAWTWVVQIITHPRVGGGEMKQIFVVVKKKEKVTYFVNLKLAIAQSLIGVRQLIFILSQVSVKSAKRSTLSVRLSRCHCQCRTRHITVRKNEGPLSNNNANIF